MSWAIGYDFNWKRDIGYGVPAVCDHPGCDERIDRGLSYVCGAEPYGGDRGCGLYFCPKHQFDPVDQSCERCFHNVETPLAELAAKELPPFEPKPDIAEWIRFKLTDESWAEWREANKEEVAKLAAAIKESAK